MKLAAGITTWRLGRPALAVTHVVEAVFGLRAR